MTLIDNSPADAPSLAILENMTAPAASPTPATMRRTSTWAILGLALAARVLVLIDVCTTHPRDWFFATRGLEMGYLANSLLHGLGYSSPFGGATGPTAFIAPGYPTLTAALFYCFGTYTFASAIAIMTVNLLFTMLTVWLILYLAHTLFNPTTAIIAGVFYAVSPPLIFIPTIFWETSISASVPLLMIALALKLEPAPTLPRWAGLGALSAVIALINPALLPTLLAILGWTAWRTRTPAKPWWLGPVLAALTLAVVFAPWPIRNALRFHAFIPLRSTVGFELWMGNRPGATGFLDESLFPVYNAHELDRYKALGEVAYTQGKSDAAKAYVEAHPAIFLTMTARRVFRFWTGTGNVVGSGVYAVHAIVTTVFGWLGLWFVWKQRSRSLAILMALPMLLFPLPYYITHAEFRYRLNIDALMTLLAAFALSQVLAQPDADDAPAPIAGS